MTKLFFLLLIVFSQNIVLSQTKFYKSNSIEVIKNSTLQNHAWVGGLNFCQFFGIDLNLDNIEDLVIYDKTGNKILTFINQGIPNSESYLFAPEYTSVFPTPSDWVILYDLNCDGRKEFITNSPTGIKVFYRDADASNYIVFKSSPYTIYSDYNIVNVPKILLYSSQIEPPGIYDVDYDGDVDFFQFTSGGTTLEWHKNLSQEKFGNCDSIDLKLSSQCWGHFAEDFNTNAVTLNVSCRPQIKSFEEIMAERNERHAGATVLMFDYNNDSLVDLLLGDISYNKLNLLTNSGTKSDANIGSQDSIFPSYNTSIDLPIFPWASYVDINNDNLEDIIASPFAGNASENTNSVWLYLNNGNATNSFELNTQSFLQENMFEFGEGAYPALFDYDKDGDLDLFVGNHGYYNAGNYLGKIAFYKNIGSSVNPIFQYETNDFLNLSNLNLSSLFPAFGDLDNDGDKDLLIGNGTGTLLYYENIAPNNGIANFQLISNNYSGLDIGQNSTPQIIDFNNDGKLDLIIGERNGTLKYFENTGTSNSPQFSANNVVNNFGGVNVKQQGFITGFSVPHITQIDGEKVLLCGAEKGSLIKYNNLTNNTFTQTTLNFENIKEGIRTSVCSGDLNGDGYLDLIVGNYSGGLSLYLGGEPNSIILNNEIETSLKVFPNPFNNKIRINLEENLIETIFIFDLNGKLIFSSNPNNKSTTIETESFKNGIYLLKCITKERTYSKKLIKTN